MRHLQDEKIDLKKTFYRIRSYWHYFVIALVLAFICAFLYNTYTIPTYRASTTLLINEGEKRGFMENNQFIEGLGMGAITQNLDNQIMVLSSRTLIGRTLDELPYDIEYYYKGFKNKLSLYPESPIKVISESGDSLPRDIEFTVKYLNNNILSLDAETNDLFELHVQGSFGEIIKTPSGRFRIELSNNYWPVKNVDNEMQFIIHSRKQLIDSYKKRLKIEKVLKTGTIVELSLEGTNKYMDIEFLNKLVEIFEFYVL